MLILALDYACMAMIYECKPLRCLVNEHGAICQKTVTSFKLGWNFTDGERIASSQDLATFDGSLQPITLSGHQVCIEWYQCCLSDCRTQLSADEPNILTLLVMTSWQLVVQTNSAALPLAPKVGQHRFAFTGTKAESAKMSPDPGNGFLVAPPKVSCLLRYCSAVMCWQFLINWPDEAGQC